MERFPEGVPFAEDDRPAQPGLEHAQGERLEHDRLVIRAGAPDLVVVTAECSVARSGPGAPRSSVVSDDYVVAHLAVCCPANLWSSLSRLPFRWKPRARCDDRAPGYLCRSPDAAPVSAPQRHRPRSRLAQPD